MSFTYDDVQALTKPSPQYVRFYRKPKPDKKGSKEKGYPVMRDEVYCEVRMEGDGLIVDKQAMLSENLPEDKQDELFLKRCDDIKYPKQWELFKSGDSEQIVGYRLDAFFVNQPSKAEYYKHFSVFTLEQLASLPDSTLTMLGTEARSDKRIAIAALERMKEESGPRLAQEQMEELEQKLLQAKDREEMLLDRLARLEKLVEATHEVSEEEVKPRRGRPRKVEQETVEI